MNKVYLATKDDLTAAMTSFAASLGASNASADDGTPVGRVVLDSVLRPGYVKANGATLTNATVDYPRLVAFVRANPELFTDNVEVQTTRSELYVYSLADDTLTLPNYMNRVLQCGETVTSVEAGLPDITGTFCINPRVNGRSDSLAVNVRGTESFFVISDDSGGVKESAANSAGAAATMAMSFAASHSNAIYGASATVQPPAITLIPQIRY